MGKRNQEVAWRGSIENQEFYLYIDGLCTKYGFTWTGCGHRVSIYEGNNLVAEYIRDPEKTTWKRGSDVLGSSGISGNIPTG